ncbi:fibronectin type III domain-containing protein [Alicyclobacillus mengziensis]|uniref:Fibronectin type III domain-containing protein n=1 Tax=Alicyclobacillus mengziensis TaxID=2931921 RepID=A0A9X7VYH3_9BACL|nr:fibronectin type III domain-containing protein [Alicyclobacillus mengziensis]QSO47426.1 fibronectin type III domain-containing protein [Alicyclobacillus mengziensis]
MKKRGLIKGFGVLATAASITALSTSVAFADTSFSAKYQANAAEEASLLQTAQSSTVTTPEISVLRTTVQNINAQVTSLYNAEQTLVADEPSMPQMNPQSLNQQIHNLEQRRHQLLKQTQVEWRYVNKFFHRPDRYDEEQFSHYKGVWTDFSSQLMNVDKQLETLMNEKKMWTESPYGGGLTSLQNAILKLQSASIRYTRDWISLEQNGGSTTTSLPAPTNLTASDVTTSGWTVSWTGVSGATSYDVYINGSQAAQVTGTSYTFTGGMPGTMYNVTVTAVDASNNQSPQSSPISLMTPIANPYTVPTNLTISNVTSSGWTVNWAAVTGATSYNIYVNGNLAVTNLDGTSYTFSGQNPNTTYKITVSAVDSGNQSAQSTAATVTTLS